ncbi:LuxR C-terminal-related transcriptional regulator [Actinoplanes sp. NBRC 103695]|uniref:helix-turn-helix transcriptional regulator n=1 Tax=Actinoplanes sp. NBRC 103695 TaxID=3032202 RepID=UPI0024A1DACB|nr:LuxR C-terminal-related transcriptional regulator [Actinoplanes sp. NBRC 103695]GLY99042.1 hypothetical protein Acsp02_62960 [Actinoplanes sp. NBRC 103695]
MIGIPTRWRRWAAPTGLDGRFDEGARILADCWQLRDQAGFPIERELQVAGLLSLFLLPLECYEELDHLLLEAGRLADTAERDWGPPVASHVVTLIRLVEGRRSYQRGDLVQAGAQLAYGLSLASRPLHTITGPLFLADVELGSGDRSASRTALVRAREVADNEPVPPFLLTWLSEAENRVGRAAARTAGLFEELTDRELSILRMLPSAATQREIGAALFLSINTVKAYNKSLYRKLGVGGRQDAVRAARRLGLI